MLNDILCVILARGGSKGIPGKNLKLLDGIPLVAHSILHAKQHIHPNHIIVSSDDSDIRDVALEYGVCAIVRPDEFATDEASSESALIHAVQNSEETKDILFLQPTSPIRFKEMIPKFVDHYRSGNFEACLTTTKIPKFFWVPQLVCTPLGGYQIEAIANYDIFNRPRKQDMDIMFFWHFDNGSSYLVRREALLRERCRFGDGKNVGVFPISDLEAMQVDTPEEFEVLELIFSGKISQWTGISAGDEIGDGIASH